MNKVRKGNYYRLKTRKWLESKGYLVEILEHSGRYSKKDIWGADLIAKNDNELIFIQVKSNKSHISTGKKELLATVWPSFVKLWVVYWEAYSKEPTIHKISSSEMNVPDGCVLVKNISGRKLHKGELANSEDIETQDSFFSRWEKIIKNMDR